MIDTDILPQELHRIEHLIALKRDVLTKNMARQWDLQQEEGRLRGDLTALETQKYRLFTGRNI